MSFKICSICERDLPATNEFFCKDRNGKLGLRSQCKECRKKYNQKYRRLNKESIQEYNKNRGKRTSRTREKKYYDEMNKEQKKDNNKLRTLHQWIKYNKKKPKYCIICNEKKTLQLSSINHTYTREIEDWLWLCQSCHSLFDKLTIKR